MEYNSIQHPKDYSDQSIPLCPASFSFLTIVCMMCLYIYLVLLVLICKYCCCKLLCVCNITSYLCCMCMYVGEHVCRPSLLCNPVIDKIVINQVLRIIKNTVKSDVKTGRI